MYENLVRISTYAKMVGKSGEMIRLRVRDGLVKSVKIDNTIFIELTEDEMKSRRK